MDKKKIEKGVRLILEGIGENPDRDGLKNTPQRVAESYEDLFRGVEENIENDFRTFHLEDQDEMILIKEIPFYSFCEHHMLPFWGNVSLAYIPDNNQVVGFSTLIKVIEHFAKRPQIQERLTTQICDFLDKHLKPRGILVTIRAHHLCVSMRGVKKEQSEPITSAMRGYLRKNTTRMEALMLLGRRD